MNDKEKADAPLTLRDKAQLALARAYPNLWGLLAGANTTEFIRLSLRQRSEGDWMAVVVRMGSDGLSEEVAFGNGGDCMEALGAMNRTLAAGRWILSRPFDKKG